ncbi:MAG: alpha/beta hydrolase [Bacteroidetes bacterium]|nr:alpha/beta hydrolase [Bacteroidota bacterium]
MHRIILLFLSTFITLSAYCQTDSAAIKKAEAEKLFPQYMSEYLAYEKAHGHYIQTPNVKMHYLTWGKPSGKALVWSHGTYGNGYEMFDFGDELAAAGYYVIAIDYYGHGLTPFADKEVSIYSVADDIKFLLDELHIKKAVMGGFSRGGTVSTVFYDAYPQYVQALVLEDGGSAPWAINAHKLTTDSLARQTINGFKQRGAPPRLFDDQKDLFTYQYARIGTNPLFKKRFFESVTRLKYVDSLGKWKINPGMNDFVAQTNAEQDIMVTSRPFNASLFAATTVLVYPKVIYRNLDIPMIIYDPVGPNDVFNFEEENTKLQLAHPQYITHKVIQNGEHAVKDYHHAEFVQDLKDLLQKISR